MAKDSELVDLQWQRLIEQQRIAVELFPRARQYQKDYRTECLKKIEEEGLNQPKSSAPMRSSIAKRE